MADLEQVKSRLLQNYSPYGKTIIVTGGTQGMTYAPFLGYLKSTGGH
jgi:hypothetical protein